MQSLPIDSLLPQIVAALRSHSNLVLQAAPGAGKTTRVPAVLLDAKLSDKEVWVLEPRRLAARMAARRVAEERGERLGETVGYQVRFEEVASARTRLRFLTEGVLTRRLLSDPTLKNVGAVVLDEFHERHLQTDLALALLRRLQMTTRPDLKLAVMSATLDAAPVAEFLGNVPALASEGRQFPIVIEHLPSPDDRPLAELVASAVGRLCADGLDGDVLVFLPGAAEIRRAQSAVAALAARHALLVLPLHGELPAAEQDRAVNPAAQRKLILSTNVAESSLTIEGVAAVVDSGLARVASHSPWSGLPTLQVARISQASAVQRAGRAGRTRPGRCLRLYTAQDFHARPAHETAELHRLDLAQPALELHAVGIADLRVFGWFEAPPETSLVAADELLRRLGAIDARGVVTETGRRMLRFPIHPRQARVLVEAQTRGAAASGCLLAALIGERDITASNLFGAASSVTGAPRGPRPARHHSASDLLDRLDLFREAERGNFDPTRLQSLGVDSAAARAVDRVRNQLLRALPKSEQAASQDEAEALLLSLLAGYPDRVARRRDLKSDEAELLLSAGGGAQLAPSSAVRGAEFLVAVDAEERREPARPNANAHGRVVGPLVRTASAIAPEWLIDLFADDLRESIDAQWNAQSERVDTVERLSYGALVLSETRVRHDQSSAVRQAVTTVLAQAARSLGWQRFADEEAAHNFLARVSFVARTFPEAHLPAFTTDDLDAALAELCDGLRSFAELRVAARGGGMLGLLRARLTGEQARLLAQMAPDAVDLAGRRKVRVNYELDRPPWIESRLQDFFGMKTGPTVAGGRVPLVLHLLAPNRRPVQVTTDLAGFWQRTYPQVRRELSRRYPRHAWPEA